jgi:hypothetical protein
MADSAMRKDNSTREVVDLSNDERWQARLAEARARREIALREKAPRNVPAEHKLKPWEIDGFSDEGQFEPVEPLLPAAPKLDFSERVDAIRAALDKPKADPEPQKVDSRPAKATLERTATSDPATPPSEAPSDSNIWLDIAEPEPEPKAEEPQPSLLIAEGAPDIAVLARTYAASLEPERVAATVDDEPESVAEPTPVQAARSRRRGLPYGLGLGLAVLLLVPFLHRPPPLEIGPQPGIPPAFRIQPALGMTGPLILRPTNSTSADWAPATTLPPNPPLQAIPALPATFAREIPSFTTAPDFGDPFGPLDWDRIGRSQFAPSAPLLTPAFPDAAFASDPFAIGESAQPALESPALEDGPLGDGIPRPLPRQTEAAPLPPAPEVFLRVTILAPQSVASATTDELAQTVSDRGHSVAAIKPVNFKITERNLRYYHAEDREEAARLAETFDARLRDFTSFRPLPAQGTVEIWLAGDSLGQAVTRTPVRAAPLPAPLPAPAPTIIVIRREPTFLDRIADALGGHTPGSTPPGSTSGTPVAGTTPTSPPETGAAAGAIFDTGGQFLNSGTGTTEGETGTGTGTSTGETGTDTSGTSSGSEDTGSEP